MKVVMATCPEPQVSQLAKALVQSRLAACVNVIPKIESTYIWDGEVQSETECLMIIKTSQGRLNELRSLFHQKHPYEVPEFIVVDVDRRGSSAAYVKWVSDLTGHT